MSERKRLSVLGARSEPPAARAPLAAGDHPVIALLGDEAEVIAFAAALLRTLGAARDVAAVVSSHGPARDALASASAVHVLDAREGTLEAWLSALPPRTPVVCLGAAAARLTPSMRIGLGRARNASAATCDLWLGYSSERVAHALGSVLIAEC